MLAGSQPSPWDSGITVQHKNELYKSVESLTHQMDKNTSERDRELVHPNNKKTLGTDLRVLAVN